MNRFNLSFKDTKRDMLIYNFIIDMKEYKSPSQFIKRLIEDSEEYKKWKENN